MCDAKSLEGVREVGAKIPPCFPPPFEGPQEARHALCLLTRKVCQTKEHFKVCGKSGYGNVIFSNMAHKHTRTCAAQRVSRKEAHSLLKQMPLAYIFV